EQPRARRRLPPRQWESAVEKQIREATERGDFDNLPGAGRPLDLRRDPNIPPDWELAFKLLKDSGFAPAWIEFDKEIRAARASLFAPLDRYLSRLAASNGRAGDERTETRVIAEFRERAAELNKQIDLFNLKAPSPRVHHVRIRIQEEIDKFRSAVEKWRG
ncbi:MAG: DnaJ family domain-containing protein, partial [Rudaea sp.]